MNDTGRKIVWLEIDEKTNHFSYTSSIDSALSQAQTEILSLDETIASVKALKPDCDAIDYALAASSGALCGLLDVFLIGKPGESPLGDITDKWFENRTCDFARICGWKGNDENPMKSAIGFLERTFKVPYDQRGCGDAGSIVFDLTPSNHHFKSLAHNPSLLGLFFSILDQFTNSSHFVSDGQLVELTDADGKFQLRGNTLFICTKCKKIFLASDVELGAMVYSVPMPCKRCGSIRTMPLLLPHYWFYKGIWESMEERINKNDSNENR